MFHAYQMSVYRTLREFDTSLLIWRVVCQGVRHELPAFELAWDKGFCVWSAGLVAVRRAVRDAGQTDIRGSSAGPWFVVGVPLSRIERGPAGEGSRLLIGGSRIPRALPGRHQPSRRV